MSYKYRILADNPLGYWSLNGDLYDLTTSSNHAVATGISYVEPPIIANGGSAMKITNSSSVVIRNTSGNYDALSKNTESNAFTISFWFDFNNQLKGDGYGKTLFTNNKLNLFYIKSGTTVIGIIYFDYITSTIRFNIYGAGGASTNQEAYYVVRDFENQYYVVASYSNGNINLVVNSYLGTPGYVTDTSYLTSFDKTSLSYEIVGNSFTGTAGYPDNFLISDVAFYDKVINSITTKPHIVWALNDGKPKSVTNTLSNLSYIDINTSGNQYYYNNTINGRDFSKYGTAYNLYVTTAGLTPNRINNVTFSNLDNIASATTSSAGTTWSNKGSIDFENVFQYFTPSQITISMQVTKPSISNKNYLFSLSNINNQNTLFVESSSTSYNVKMYDPYSDSELFVASTTLPPSVGTSSVGMIIQNDFIYLFTSDAGTASATVTDLGFQSISFLSNTALNIGNSKHSASSNAFTFYNVGITDRNVSDFNNFDFTSASTFLIKLTDSTNPYKVSQYGDWKIFIPSAIYDDIEGSTIDWTSLDNCKVYTSLDNGYTFTEIQRDSEIPNYSSSTIPGNVLIKVQMVTDYESNSNVSSFNNLTIMLPRRTTMVSNGSIHYLFTPIIDPSLSHPTFKSNQYQVFSRSKNLGIRFSGKPSAASVNSGGNTYYGLEFWYRPDAILSGSNNYLLNPQESTSSSPSIYISSSGNFAYGGGLLYINGASVSNNTYPASANYLYHLMLSIPLGTASSLYLNGSLTPVNSISSSGTYGELTFWNVPVSASEVYDRYQSFVSTKTTIINDENTIKVLGNQYLDSASGYKIGS